MDKDQLQMATMGYSVKEIPASKSIPRRTFYKPDGTPLPNLPADPYHLPRYLKRGFLLDPPTINPQPTFTCPDCGKVLKTALALAGHRRSHKST